MLFHGQFLVPALLLATSMACSGPRTRTPRSAFDQCRELDARTGVAPSDRLACWSTLLRRPCDLPADARAHAELRVRNLSGPPGAPVVPEPAPVPQVARPGPPAGACPAPCLDAARDCDARCGTDPGWADCLSRCDRTLTACCFAAR